MDPLQAELNYLLLLSACFFFGLIRQTCTSVLIARPSRVCLRTDHADRHHLVIGARRGILELRKSHVRLAFNGWKRSKEISLWTKL